MHPISRKLVKCFYKGNKVLICGNGGSATMASHFTGELVCTFENKKRPALPAICLNVDPAVMTAWSNDFGYDTVFSRQIQALGKKGDYLIVLSTSGKSKNCLSAKKMANKYGLEVIDFPRGRGKGSTATRQEYQLRKMHLICREIEREMFPWT